MSAEAQIKSFVDRVLRLKEEQDTIGQDIRDIYAEAKSLGFDKTQLGNVVSHVRKVEKKGRDAINEGNAIFDMYLAAYEGTGTPVAKRAHTHEAEPEKAGKRLNATDIYLAACQEAENDDPETGEILESVQSHDALGPSASAGSAPDDMPAEIHESPSNRDVSADGEAWAPGAPQGYPDQPQAKAEVEASNDEPHELAGHEGRSEGEAASVSLPTISEPDGDAIGEVKGKARLPDAAGVEPSPSVTFTNPKCLKPKTCPNAHSKTACFDCVMEYGKRPPEEQKRLWAEAIGDAA